RDANKTEKIQDKLDETLSDQTKDDLQTQVEQLREDIAAIAATLANLGSQTVREEKQTAKQTYQRAFMQGEDMVDDLKVKAQDIEAQLTATVRERPLASLATALGIGYLLAILSRR